VAGSLGGELLTVRLEMVGPDEPETRVITVTSSGRHWATRWPMVQSALVRWVAEC
jgi:hypothetical protein